MNSSGVASSASFSSSEPAGGDRGDRVGARRARDRPVVLLRRLAERRLQPVVSSAQQPLDLGDESGRLVRGQNALLDQLPLVQLPNRRMRVDLLDHQRLRVGGLVLLVVTEAAVADEIDQDVLAEAAPVGHRQPHGGERRLRVVGVDVDDRNVEALGEVRRVARRAPLVRIGGEPDLVVRDQVERAAGRVAREIVEVEGLRDDPLPRERGVAVQQDRQRHRGVVRAVPGRAIGLLGPSPALDHRVDGLEVARIRNQAHAHLAVGRRARPVRREVVLHVAGPAFGIEGDSLDRPLAFELAQDVLVGHADRVGEHVQATAVRHPEDDLVRARFGGELDRLVEHRDHHVETLERELLLTEEALA